MAYITTLNMVPEDGENDVPIEELIRLHVVSVGGVALDALTKVYVTRGHEGTRRLAYDQNAGGFQAPYNGANSSATVVSSPGSAVDDELWLQLDYTADYYSLEVVLVEVYASTGAGTDTYYHTYSFTIEDLTAPEITELLWFNPWTCRIKFDEPVATDTDAVGGSAYVAVALGAAVVLGTQGADASQVQLSGLTLTGDEAGLWFQMAGSAYPQNNQPRLISAVDAASGIITVDVTGSAGYMKADDGKDYDASGILVRERTLKASISPYYFEARLSEEGASGEVLSADRVQCAFCPLPIAAVVATTDEIPAGEDYRKYVTLTLEQDISYGRLYTLHAKGVDDIWQNRTSDAAFDFTSPTFGAPTERLKIWSNGLIPAPDRTDDLEQEQRFRKLAVVLQDAANMLWYRIDQLQYLDDADLCPSSWVDQLLYSRGNPFRFELENEDQKRLLAAALPGFYKKVGTEADIIEMIRLLTGITVTITDYTTGDYWILGYSSLAALPAEGAPILAPSDPYRLNCWEIVSPVDLTDRQRRIMWDVGEWTDPADMHLIRIIEPSSGGGLGAGYWTLNVSALGLSTTVGI